LAIAGAIGLALVAGVVAATAPASGRADEEVAPLSARVVRGAKPYAFIKNGPAPKLIVDPPLPDLVAQGVVWIQWRVENVRILPAFGKGPG
jgi:hypothetical protein